MRLSMKIDRATTTNPSVISGLGPILSVSRPATGPMTTSTTVVGTCSALFAGGSDRIKSSI